jgi:hypothetical protein
MVTMSPFWGTAAGLQLADVPQLPAPVIQLRSAPSTLALPRLIAKADIAAKTALPRFAARRIRLHLELIGIFLSLQTASTANENR